VNTQSSQAPEQNDWQEFKPLFGDGKIKVCDTLRAVTPFGGLSVFIEFLGRVGLVEQLANQASYQPKSGHHYDPGQILVGFILSVIAGAQRFAHTNQLRADRALHALLGMKRFPSDCNLGDFGSIGNLLGDLRQFGDDRLNSLPNSALQRGRIRACGHVPHSFPEDRFGENCRRRRAVAGYIRGLRSHFTHQLRTHVLVGVFELDLFG
jgi:hypothetical protein